MFPQLDLRQVGDNCLKGYRHITATLRMLTLLLWMRCIRMPRLYEALGRRLAAAAKLPQSLSDRKAMVVRLQEKLSASVEAAQVLHESGPGSPQKGVFIRYGAIFRDVYCFVRCVPIRLRLAKAYHALGKESFLAYGKRSIPPELLDDFGNALSQQQHLQACLVSCRNYVASHKAAVSLIVCSALVVCVLCGLRVAWVAVASRPRVTDGREKAWQAEANTDQSPHTFRFDDQLRQSAFRASPWRIETDSGLNDYARQIDSAIKQSLGRESFVFPGREFQGVPLCIPFMKLKSSNWSFPTYLDYLFLFQLPGPTNEDDRIDPWERDRRIAIDSTTGRVVCVMLTMRSTDIAEIQGRLIETFGRTSQDIESNAFKGVDYVKKWSIIKYTFPETVVRVVTGREIPLRAGFPASGNRVEIWVVDRSYVEQSLRAYANAFITCCRWMEAVRGLRDPNKGVPVERVPRLADTTMLMDDSKQSAVFVDAALEREAKRITAIRARPQEEQIVLPTVDGLVGGVGNYEDRSCIIVARPGVPSTSGIGRLWTPGVDMSPFSVASCAIGDVLWELSSVLAQAQFPPSGDSISIIDPREVNYLARWDSSFAVADQIRGAFQVTRSKRHEWVDRHGWVVSVGVDGSVSLLRPSGADQ